jgi:hypothetical protein
MRILIVVICILFPVTVIGQNYQMPGGDMQKMMMEMQECMAKVDQAQIQKLEQKAKSMEQELKTLCQQGKRDQAQKQALKYSKEMQNNPALMQMKKCAEISKKMMPAGMMPDSNFDFDTPDGHVCDDMK